MSIGSFDPPPVKIVALMLPQLTPVWPAGQSADHAISVAPVVLLVVPQRADPVFSWQTRSQSSAGPTGAAAFAETALPSSSNRPVLWTARAMPETSSRLANRTRAATIGSARHAWRSL